MFSSAKIFCLNILIILFCLVIKILCDCRLNNPADSRLIPNYYKYVGRHKIKIRTYGGGLLTIHDGQTIEAHCESNFEYPQIFKEFNKVKVSCIENYIQMSTDDSYQYSHESTLRCLLPKWNLYESVTNYTWCPLNVTSYIVAKHDFWKPFNLLAGICYDIYDFSFYSVYYTLAPNKTQIEYPSVFDDLYHPGIEIKYIIETFGSNSILGNVFENDQFEQWITDVKYEFRSMIQHPKLEYIFNGDFSSLLEFVWWPNLRLYNWKRYINALDEHVERDNQIYDILAGVSGAVTVPILKSCQTNYTMEEIVFDSNRRVPLYVWNYLKNRANSSNEMVIIGFNSPFNEFYSNDNIVFCPDICKEIPWLKEEASSFRYNIMGTIFCCKVEDVRSSKRLHGFPLSDIKPKPTRERIEEASEDAIDETTENNHIYV